MPVLSCDNLPHSGAVTARVVTEFAEAVDAKLGRWVRDNVAFPGTMIDRIVPATTDADRAEVAALTGLDDAWPVVASRFCSGWWKTSSPGSAHRWGLAAPNGQATSHPMSA
jgi:fructuronate reductase